MGPAILRTVCQLACSLLLLSQAFGVQRTEKHAEHGFSLARTSSFEARPVPSDEAEMLLIYAPKDAPQDRRAPVTHAVYRIEGGGDPSLDLQRWILGALSPSSLEKVRSVRVRYGRKPARFTGERFDEDGNRRSLFVHGWASDEDLIVFVGECEVSMWRREKRAMERVASSFEFFTKSEVSAQREKWTRRYRRSSLPHREERIDVASKLVDGWSVRDTKHSIILYHGPSDAPVLAQIARNLIAIRGRFALDFPPDRPLDALSVVRVCRDRGEYLTYGGNPSTVGYFNSQTQELVFFDARVEKSGSMPDDHPTMRTLYHEACHQFLHHTASALSPHSWFDEGTAEFYAGAHLHLGQVKGIGGLDDRERFLRESTVQSRLPALEDLLGMDQQTFYANADVNYSMAYAFVRFLRSAPEAEREHEWKGLLERYFESLRKTWRREAESLVLSGLNVTAYRAAVERSRAAALEAALIGVDLADLEATFVAWTRKGSN